MAGTLKGKPNRAGIPDCGFPQSGANRAIGREGLLSDVELAFAIDILSWLCGEG